MRLGICQVHTEQWDLEGNTARTLAALEAAADGGAELAITPECVFHGYGFDGRDDYLAALTDVAEPVSGERVGRVRELAARTGMHVTLGFAERGEADRIHNSAAMILPTGEIGWVYRKVHCRDFETAGMGGGFTPGDRFHVSDLELPSGRVRVGAVICFDREMTGSLRCLRALGAEFAACPLATNTFGFGAGRGRADNEMVTRVRAAENELPIAVVNHAGRFNGGSFVVGAVGEVLEEMGPGAEVRVIDVDLEAVRRLHANPLGWMGWGFRRPEAYAPALGVEE